MGGYELREGVAQGTAKQLEAHLVLFGDSAGVPSGAIAVFDLERLGRRGVEAIKNALGKQGLPPEALLVLYTHTHSSPRYNLEERGIGTGYEEHGELERYYLETLPRLTTEMYKAARQDMRPARARYARAKVEGVGSNRHDGSPSLAPWLHLVAFYTGGESSNPDLVVANYACHPTVLGADNLLYSPDFPGYFRDGLSGAFPNGPQVIFTNGAAGDISARHTRREQTEEESKRLGLLLATAAEEALKTAREIKISPVNCALDDLALSTRTFPSPEAGDALAAEALQAYEQALEAGASAPVLRRLLTTWQGADITARYAKLGIADSISGHIQGIRVGDVLFLGVPGELYASGDSLIRERIGAADSPILVCGFANDYLGYLVDGGDAGDEYENLATPFRNDSFERLLAAVIELGRGLVE